MSKLPIPCVAQRASLLSGSSVVFLLAVLSTASVAQEKPATPPPQPTPAPAPTPAPTPAPDPAQERDNPNAGGAPSKDAMRFGSPGAMPQTSSREGMWPAPTAEDWKKPCLVQWQRSFEDALLVSKATNKPIMVCVNMDGEIASEHYAGVRYRQPETAQLFEPYVCVIASVYRHTPRDYDEEGRRIPCPRFGTVTCGEHIRCEPALYERYFDERRIAPRHILVEQNLAETFDVFYAWDTTTIFTALKEGAKNRPPPKIILHDDLPLAQRAASADAVDRQAVENAYLTGTEEVRRALIASAAANPAIDQTDLLRLAIFGFDIELARAARGALANAESEASIDLIADALKVAMDPKERDMLMAAVVRLAEKHPRARTLAAVHEGLSKGSQLIDAKDWMRALETQDPAATRTAYMRSASLEGRAAAAESNPKDAAALLDLAEAFLSRAQDPATERRFVSPLLDDARNKALDAQKLGASGWRLHALLAYAMSARKERDKALEHAVLAIEGGMPRPGTSADASEERTAVTVLQLFAQARQRAIARAYRERAAWPPEWLADVHAAYSVLAKHPLGTDEDVAAYYDFLRWLGATPRANQVLAEGMARFADARTLHDRLRSRILWEKGPDELEATYAAMLAEPDASKRMSWFAGYASLVAAEHHRRSGKIEKALASYDKAMAHYEADIARVPEDRANADHYIALALAGRARIALERGDWVVATDEILASFERKPQAAASPDGLNISPVDSAKMLRAKLQQPGLEALLARLQAGLDALDPKMLELPAYEREVPPARGERNRQRR
jgi:hypothetical protein